jgi:hypothetical protein
VNPKNDVSHLVERLEAFEERLGLSLQGLFAYRYNAYCTWQDHGEVISGDEPRLTLSGEVVAAEKPAFGSGFYVVGVAYDSFDRVVRTRSDAFTGAYFLGFGVFSITIEILGEAAELSRIRVYPQAYSHV